MYQCVFHCRLIVLLKQLNATWTHIIPSVSACHIFITILLITSIEDIKLLFKINHWNISINKIFKINILNIYINIYTVQSNYNQCFCIAKNWGWISEFSGFYLNSDLNKLFLKMNNFLSGSVFPALSLYLNKVWVLSIQFTHRMTFS